MVVQPKIHFFSVKLLCVVSFPRLYEGLCVCVCKSALEIERGRHLRSFRLNILIWGCFPKELLWWSGPVATNEQVTCISCEMSFCISHCWRNRNTIVTGDILFAVIANVFPTINIVCRERDLTPPHAQSKSPHLVNRSEIERERAFLCCQYAALLQQLNNNDFSKSSVFDDPTRPHTKRKRFILVLSVSRRLGFFLHSTQHSNDFAKKATDYLLL